MLDVFSWDFLKSKAYVDIPNTIVQLKDEKQYYITFTIYLFIYQIIYYK